MAMIRVVWKELDDAEKELVVALFNNSAFGIDDKKGRGFPRLWCSCNIDHPCQTDEENGIWDATASIEDGHLVLVGSSGPGGARPEKREVLPDDVEMDIGAVVGV